MYVLTDLCAAIPSRLNTRLQKYLALVLIQFFWLTVAAEGIMLQRGQIALYSLIGATLTLKEPRPVPSSTRSDPLSRTKNRAGTTLATEAQTKNLVLADRAFAGAEELYKDWKANSFRKAVRKYEEASLHYRRAGNKRDAARALKRIGDVCFILSENKKALDFFKKSLTYFQRADDWQGEIDALNQLASVYVDLGEATKTLNLANQAKTLSKKRGYLSGEAEALNTIGLAQFTLSQLRESVKVFEESISIWEKVGEPQGPTQTLINIGYAYNALGDIGLAVDFYQRALHLSTESRHLRLQALALTAIGGIYAFRGEKQKALSTHERALQLFRTIGDRNGEAATLNGIGYAYEDLGDYPRAFTCYSSALRLYERAGHRNFVCLTIGYVGEIYFLLGQRRKALKYVKRKWSLSRALGDRQMQAYTLRDIGLIYESLGRKRQALRNYKRSLWLSGKVGDKRAQAYAFNNIGNLYEGMGNVRKALNLYNQALELIKVVEDSRGVTLTLYNIARVQRDTGNFTDAQIHIETALKIIEDLRTKVDSQDLRTSYFASVHQYYELYIDLLMRIHKQNLLAGFDVTAFEASERARARIMLETLNLAHADIHQGVDPALVELEQSLKEKIAVRAAQKTQLLSSNATQEQISEIRNELSDLLRQYQDIRARIKETGTRYSTLTQPEPQSRLEIQSEVLDSDTILLEYFLGERYSYLWAVTPDSITSYVLPGRVEIESYSRRLLNHLVSRPPVSATSAQSLRLRGERAYLEYCKQARHLSKILLGPVGQQLGTKKLLIVAEGILQYIPFSCLAEPEVQAYKGGNNLQPCSSFTPLMVNHEIISLASASVISFLRKEMAGRKPPPKTIAVLADPVFERNDSRVKPTGGDQASPGFEDMPAASFGQTRSPALNTRGVTDFPRLLSTRLEAELILSLVPAEQSLKALDFAASRVTATGEDISQYRIVHFATHGIIDTEHAELSAVVLSLVDEKGEPQDGYLRLQDIYNLKLTSDLVVLSACDLALGKDIKGEGLVGMTRGFMYAGAARVIASLWQVDEDSAAETMKIFYEKMLIEGARPSSALRQAQVYIWAMTSWKEPYYWAGFTHQGEWR